MKVIILSTFLSFFLLTVCNGQQDFTPIVAEFGWFGTIEFTDNLNRELDNSVVLEQMSVIPESMSAYKKLKIYNTIARISSATLTAGVVYLLMNKRDSTSEGVNNSEKFVFSAFAIGSVVVGYSTIMRKKYLKKAVGEYNRFGYESNLSHQPNQEYIDLSMSISGNGMGVVCRF